MLYISQTIEAEILQLYKLERLCHHHPWTLGILQDCFEVGYLCHTFRLNTIVDKENFITAIPLPTLENKVCCSNPIGFMMNQIIIDECHLLTICVHPELQGNGIARMALTWLINLMREKQMKSIHLEVWVENAAAIKLYKNLGFEKVRIRKNYYEQSSGSGDALVLKLDL